MKSAAVCRGCGEESGEGAFCYRLGAAYWCRSCVADSAVIVSAERYVPALTIAAERKIGRYREREIRVPRRE